MIDIGFFSLNYGEKARHRNVKPEQKFVMAIDMTKFMTPNDTCLFGMFQCRENDYCYSMPFRCNGIQDCPQGEDEVNTIRILEEYRTILSRIVKKHHGRVVDSPGDPHVYF